MSRISRLGVLLALGSLASGCAGIPEGIEPVAGFELERYVGTWYELARLDHRFERGLTDVSAEYSRRDDGGIDVVNRGFDTESGEWEEAKGKARFTGGPDIGQLKVSFFGPFYSAYNIFELDEDYRYAMVTAAERDYLWILARSPQLGQATLDRLVARAAELGFATDELIFVTHERFAR